MRNECTFKYETHVHSLPASACAYREPEEVVERYAAAGYSGMFLTDHFFNGNCAIPEELPWTMRVQFLCNGFHRAKRRGDKIGFNVFFGYEYNSNGAEFLVLNSCEQFLYDNPDMPDWGLRKFLRRARGAGAFVVHAHPCRDLPWIKNPRSRFPRQVDAVEVFNAAQKPEWNPPAAEYARQCRLPAFSGSDNHDPRNLQGGGVALRKNPATAAEFVALVKAGEYALLKNFTASCT